MNSPSHEYFMRKCIELALIAKQSGDSPVGAIIVKDGEIIGEGIEAGKKYRDITYHAEIEAIRHATQAIQSQDLSEYILYTTHEPCIMCSYMIRHTKIKTIVVGVTSGEIGGFSSNLPVLTDISVKKWAQPPIIIKGVLENECRNI